MDASTRNYRPENALWQRALDGNRDAFEEAVAPLNNDLLGFARRQVQLQRQIGQIKADELTPEELMGEGLVAAYERRERFDGDSMRFRAWLLGLQHRALVRVLRREADYAARKAISLDEEVPQHEDEDAVEEAIYEFRQPFDVTTYEELFAGSAPADVEIRFNEEGHMLDRLSEEERAFIERQDVALDAEAREVALFHDEFALTLPEVAQILEYSLKDTAEALNLARATLRAHIGSAAIPPAEGDRIDSYTGESIGTDPEANGTDA